MNLFRHTFTRRARAAASHEISPEDVFLDSQNLSKLDLNQMEGQLERPLGKHIFYISTCNRSFAHAWLYCSAVWHADSAGCMSMQKS
jgi:hypothetical protein